MADITITCPNCGNTITVSEFVSAEFINCIKCKTQVAVPDRAPTKSTEAPKLKLAIEKPPQQPVLEPVAPARNAKKWFRAKATPSRDVRQYLPKTHRRPRNRRVSNFEVKVLPWLLFVVLALVLGCLRYWPGALPKDISPTFISGGVWALLFLHITVVCYAFTDDAFFGILCLIIPGYSIYYLYMQADQMYLRAVVGALIVSFGLDFAIATKDLWDGFYADASRWIATTETLKK